MRYIDADNLKSVKSIQSADFNTIETIREWIDNQPTADVVEVVRCKDCIYRFGSSCKWREDETPDHDDYCSIGEKL